jgi:hypothetical protein
MRGVPHLAEFAVAVPVTVLLVEECQVLVLNRSNHVVVVATTLSPTSLMPWKLSVRNVVLTLTSHKRQGLSLNG